MQPTWLQQHTCYQLNQKATTAASKYIEYTHAEQLTAAQQTLALEEKNDELQREVHG